jgi:catechol 2,3-dioxygenase-like lactoylglutathione lyase family enzyme
MSSPRRALSHVDIRVRDRAAAIAYYDRLLGALGMSATSDGEWIEYSSEPDITIRPDWFALIEDACATPGSTRVAFAASSRDDVDTIAGLLASIGSRSIEGPEFAYGPDYYAVFFEDPEGNKLEVCCIGR